MSQPMAELVGQPCRTTILVSCDDPRNRTVIAHAGNDRWRPVNNDPRGRVDRRPTRLTQTHARLPTSRTARSQQQVSQGVHWVHDEPVSPVTVVSRKGQAVVATALTPCRTWRQWNLSSW